MTYLHVTHESARGYREDGWYRGIIRPYAKWHGDFLFHRKDGTAMKCESIWLSYGINPDRGCAPRGYEINRRQHRQDTKSLFANFLFCRTQSQIIKKRRIS